MGVIMVSSLRGPGERRLVSKKMCVKRLESGIERENKSRKEQRERT